MADRDDKVKRDSSRPDLRSPLPGEVSLPEERLQDCPRCALQQARSTTGKCPRCGAELGTESPSLEKAAATDQERRGRWSEDHLSAIDDPRQEIESLLELEPADFERDRQSDLPSAEDGGGEGTADRAGVGAAGEGRATLERTSVQAVKDFVEEALEVTREGVAALPRPSSLPLWLRVELIVFAALGALIAVAFLIRPWAFVSGSYHAEPLGVRLTLPAPGLYRDSRPGEFGPLVQFRDHHLEPLASTLLVLGSAALPKDHGYAARSLPRSESAALAPETPLDVQALLIDAPEFRRRVMQGLSMPMVFVENRGCLAATVGERRAARCRMLLATPRHEYEGDLIVFGTNVRLVTALLLNRAPVSMQQFHSGLRIIENLEIVPPDEAK